MKKSITLSIVMLLVLALGFTAFSPKADSSASEAPFAKKFGGLALYTVRDAMGKDPKGTLKAVADAGYAYVEAAGYADGKFYGMEPTEFKAYLKSLGLTAKSSHMGMVNLENADKLIADTKAAGIEYFVIPVPPMGMFKFDPATRKMGMTGTPEQIVEILNTIGEKCTNAGLKLLYHNHDFEFLPLEDGTILTDYILDNSDPKYVNFQMDLYWVTKAGVDPLTYFQRYPGRFKAWHVKDMNDEGQFAPVGTGNIDFKRILAEKKQSGLEYYLVEQDNTFGLDPLEAIKISHAGLEEIGFK